MKKILLTAITGLVCTAAAFAQNFEPAPSVFQQKLEQYIGRYGTPERVYLNDTKNNTFDGRAGELYLVAFVYDVNAKEDRRMLVYEVGPKGEKLNPKYPGYSKGFRGESGAQLFHVRIDPPDTQPVTKYKIDTTPGAKVYIYKLILGVK